MPKVKKKRGRPKSRPNHEVYAEIKNRKKKIKPGFWSNIDTDLAVEAKLIKNIPDFYFPSYLGKYITYDDGYKEDGYRALVKITTKDLKVLLYEHGIDEVLAACEKSLNLYKNKKGKKILGDVVIYDIVQEKLSDNPPCLVCTIKTNRKRIPKFMGISNEKLQVF